MASTPDEEHDEHETTFDDVFVQNVDLRWCLLTRCDVASLTALRQLGIAFVHDVPVALNSVEWCALPSNIAALHAAQWAAGGDNVLHLPLSQPVGQTVVRLQCADDITRATALANGAQRDQFGEPVIVLHHPVGVERMLNAAQLTAMAPAMAPFLRDPLEHTTIVVAGATHNNGPVQTVSAAPNAIARSEQDSAAPTRVRAYRSRHLVASGGLDRTHPTGSPPTILPSYSLQPTAYCLLPTSYFLLPTPLQVASGGLDGISRVYCVTPAARADALCSAPLSIQGAQQHANTPTRPP